MPGAPTPTPQLLHTPDGQRLHLQHWRASPAAGPLQGTVQIVHGLGEHIGRYDALARRLTATGWHVAGHDHRGHGRSSGARGALPVQPALLPDLALAIDAVRAAPDGAGPHHVLLGHSMGGLIAARFVAEGLMQPSQPWYREMHGLVLSSPALDIGLGWPQRALLAVLRPLMPALALSNGLQAAWLSRDPAAVRAYEADPLMHDRITARLLHFMVSEAEMVQRLASRWRTPTLLLWAGADRCVRPEGSARFAAAAPPGVVQAQGYPPLFHEIFNEPEHAEVEARLLAWLGTLPAPAPA
jgi:alpha-beta hydrolase superfamily lysophospholipase